MFKKLDKKAKEAIEAVQPTRTPEQVEAERVIARGERIKKLSNEACMWRAFATGCIAGRYVNEDYRSQGSSPGLNVSMDEDTALLWREFAMRMADDRERRLREALGV